MAEIFVSYRSGDNAYVAADIHDMLALRFGAGRVFRDCDSMMPGENYPASIRTALARCRVLVAVIGPGWLEAVDESGRRRVDDARDWVRHELSFAFAHGVPVVPVLLDGAAPPRVSQLPGDIQQLGRTQAHRVRHRRFKRDLSELTELITTLVPGLPGAPPLPQAGTDFTQRNEPRDGAVVFANQGGDQFVWNPAPGGGARP